jgi:hypothetical protein
MTEHICIFGAAFYDRNSPTVAKGAPKVRKGLTSIVLAGTRRISPESWLRFVGTQEQIGS